MSGFLQILQENPLAVAFGAAGLLCQLIWPILHRRQAILAAQFGIGADYSLQYALLGAWNGAAITAVGALQSAVSFFAGERPWLRQTGILFLPVVMTIIYASWSGIQSLFALAAVTLIMVGRIQHDTLRLRILLLSAAPFGIGYDIVVGALPALIGGIVSATIASIMLVRELKSRRQVSHGNVSANNFEPIPSYQQGGTRHD